MIIAVPKESAPGERRVALVPDGVRALLKTGNEVVVAPGAGWAAGFSDEDYQEAGARLEPDSATLLQAAELMLRVQSPSDTEIAGLRPEAATISLLRPLDEPERIAALAARGLTSFALELIPRITRAQAMDVLSSQATVAGYRAVLLAAGRLLTMCPMLVTAAGTISPARFFVIGAGVAGLQAIATARRLGAVVEAYDTRAAAAEQVQSLGARFVELALDAGDAEDSGGYAKAQSDDFYARQRELMASQAARSDVVILTALVPGQPAPLLLDQAGLDGMKPGSVVVDLAAPNGGNCAATKPGEDVVVNGVQVLGPLNLPSDLPTDASAMFSKNVVTLVQHLLEDGALKLDLEDEITRGALVANRGAVTNQMVRDKLAAAEGA